MRREFYDSATSRMANTYHDVVNQREMSSAAALAGALVQQSSVPTACQMHVDLPASSEDSRRAQRKPNLVVPVPDDLEVITEI